MSPSNHPPQIDLQETHLSHLTQTIRLAHHAALSPTNFRVGCVIVCPRTQQVVSTGYTGEFQGNTHAEQNALAKLLLGSSSGEGTGEGGGGTGGIEKEVDLTKLTLYTSLEPCSKRLSGNESCVARIISLFHHHQPSSITTTPQPTTTNNNDTTTTKQIKITKVIFGAKEPHTFVQDSQSCNLMTEAGLQWEYIPDLEGVILEVAMEGHSKQHKTEDEVRKEGGKDEGEGKGKDKGGEAEDLHSRVDAAQRREGVNKSAKSEEEEEGRRLPTTTEANETQPRNPKKRMMEYIPQ